MSKQIALPNGYFATVDDEDYEWLNQWTWHRSNKGYVRRLDLSQGGRRLVTIHRLILDAPDGLQVDHRDGDKLNNRRANLRLATNRQNSCNKTVRIGVSGYRGVTWRKRSNLKPWYARIKVDGVYIDLGLFADKVEAAKAYDAAAKKHHGEFARLNFTESEGSND